MSIEERERVKKRQERGSPGGFYVRYSSLGRLKMGGEKPRERERILATPPRPETSFKILIDELISADGDIRKKMAAAGIAYVPPALILAIDGLMRFGLYAEDVGGEAALSVKKVKEELGDDAYEELYSSLFYLEVLDHVLPTAPGLRAHISRLIRNFLYPQIQSNIEESYGRQRIGATGLLIGPRSTVARVARGLEEAEEETE